MIDREVMQQALDALLGYKPHSLTHAKEQGSAIIALRAAIAQPEQKANFCFRCGKLVSAIHDIHTCTPPVGHTN